MSDRTSVLSTTVFSAFSLAFASLFAGAVGQAGPHLSEHSALSEDSGWQAHDSGWQSADSGWQ